MIRIGRVTNIYPSTGKVKVMYEDTDCASLPLSMITMNKEYSMPAVGDRVVTLHMDKGSSKGFVVGTYYGGNTQPKAISGYRKDFDAGVYVLCENGEYILITPKGQMKLGTQTVLKADAVTIEADDIILKCSYGTITVEEIMRRLERLEAES